eukprot:g1996.t1
MADNEPREEPEEAEGKVPEQKQPEDPEVRVLAEAVGAMRAFYHRHSIILASSSRLIRFFHGDQAFVLNWAKKLV